MPDDDMKKRNVESSSKTALPMINVAEIKDLETSQEKKALTIKHFPIAQVGTNDNHLTLVADELQKAHKTWEGTPVKFNYLGLPADNITGKVDHVMSSAVDVGWVTNTTFDGKTVYGDLSITEPKTKEKILRKDPQTGKREINYGSQGSWVDLECNICGDNHRHCSHERGQLYDGKVCAPIGRNIQGIHVALTNDPADLGMSMDQAEVVCSSKDYKLNKPELKGEDNSQQTVVEDRQVKNMTEEEKTKTAEEAGKAAAGEVLDKQKADADAKAKEDKTAALEKENAILKDKNTELEKKLEESGKKLEGSSKDLEAFRKAEKEHLVLGVLAKEKSIATAQKQEFKEETRKLELSQKDVPFLKMRDEALQGITNPVETSSKGTDKVLDNSKSVETASKKNNEDKTPTGKERMKQEGFLAVMNKDHPDGLTF